MIFRLQIKHLLLMLTMLFLSPRAKAEVVWYPLPAEAYKLGDLYPEAQHLLFAFDYGHALVYEKLLNSNGQIPDPQAFEKSLLSQIISILKNPPTTKVDE